MSKILNIAVIFAGGVGTRMNKSDKPKQFLEINNKPILIHTLEIFQNNKNIDFIVLVCVKSWINYAKELIGKYKLDKVSNIVPGGKTGQLSIYNGLLVAEKIAGSNKAIVLIHDGVRPLINSDIIDKNIDSVKKYNSAITSVKVTETVLLVDKADNINSVPDRESSRLARAPQSFWLKDILNNHRKALSENKDSFVDSCSLMQNYGNSLHLIDGPKENIKITTREDFYIFRAIVDFRENTKNFETGKINDI